MGKIEIENDKFLYTDHNDCEILLDCRNFMENKSKIPMHSFAPEALTIPKLVLECLNQHEALCNGQEEADNGYETLILNLLLVSELIKKAFPMKVLEIGCNSGIVSYYLAILLGIFDRENTLCCVSDTIGNTSGNQWLDRISLVNYPPRLAMEAADYDNTMLESESFDIAFINGSVHFEEPYHVIKEAERLVKSGGRIVCYACNSPLLENGFRVRFSERKEYSLKPDVCILSANKDGREKDAKENRKEWRCEADAFFAELLYDLNMPPEEETMRRLIKQCDRLVSVAADNEDTNLKIQLIDIKELLIGYLLNGDASIPERIRLLIENSQSS